MAHRLSQTPGKCEQIHGHSWWATLCIRGQVDKQGLLAGLEFGIVKQQFRAFLDEQYDHHLLLNTNDRDISSGLPGVRWMMGEPTTENIARDILLWAQTTFQGTGRQFRIEVWETSVNCAIVGDF